MKKKLSNIEPKPTTRQPLRLTLEKTRSEKMIGTSSLLVFESTTLKSAARAHPLKDPYVSHLPQGDTQQPATWQGKGTGQLAKDWDLAQHKVVGLPEPGTNGARLDPVHGPQLYLSAKGDQVKRRVSRLHSVPPHVLRRRVVESLNKEVVTKAGGHAQVIPPSAQQPHQGRRCPAEGPRQRTPRK